MGQETLFREVIAQANRANPYPLYAKLRETPVSRQHDGTYVVSTYREITSLIYDPRVTVDERKRYMRADLPAPQDQAGAGNSPAFLLVDPPEHGRLRGAVMRHFGPPEAPGLVEGMRGRIQRRIDELVDRLHEKGQFDVVDDFAYPLPVAVICELLGVPHEDEPRFRVWSELLADTLDPDPSSMTPEKQRRTGQAAMEIAMYMGGLIQQRMQRPGDDLLSRVAIHEVAKGRMSPQELVSTAIMLLIAGHETTVNLVTNGMLTLLRAPEQLARLREEPALVPGAVEELLRYEPPVQFRTRTTLEAIDLAGVTIPKGAPLVLLLASGSRDPERFADPDRFDPTRSDNQHLGFGGGIHYCFGAPLARLETQLALDALLQRLDAPKLLADPPDYRTNPALRGPRHLQVSYRKVHPRGS